MDEPKFLSQVEFKTYVPPEDGEVIAGEGIWVWTYQSERSHLEAEFIAPRSWNSRRSGGANGLIIVMIPWPVSETGSVDALEGDARFAAEHVNSVSCKRWELVGKIPELLDSLLRKPKK